MNSKATYHRRFMPVEERIRSLIGPPNVQGCRLWWGHSHSGYPAIRIGPHGRQKSHRVSRVLWELHHGPIPVGLNVLHRCDNPPCCEVTHFFLGTQADNVADMVAKGRQSKAHRTMSEEQAREALALYRSGMYTLQEIADKYKVTIQAIWLLGKGRNWKRLHTEPGRTA